jgi:hypothetical protein
MATTKSQLEVWGAMTITQRGTSGTAPSIRQPRIRSATRPKALDGAFPQPGAEGGSSGTLDRAISEGVSFACQHREERHHDRGTGPCRVRPLDEPLDDWASVTATFDLDP